MPFSNYFKASQRDIKAPPKIPGCASLGSALGFFKRSLIEAKRAGSDAHPGQRVAISDMKRHTDLDNAPGAVRDSARGWIITSPPWNFVRWRERIVLMAI